MEERPGARSTGEKGPRGHDSLCPMVTEPPPASGVHRGLAGCSRSRVQHAEGVPRAAFCSVTAAVCQSTGVFWNNPALHHRLQATVWGAVVGTEQSWPQLSVQDDRKRHLPNIRLGTGWSFLVFQLPEAAPMNVLLAQQWIRPCSSPTWSLCSRFKTLMTNKSEQDGDSGKTIEISDIKYHIFQVCGLRSHWKCSALCPLRSPSRACPSGRSVL